jgi:hypothetical protein
MSTSRELIDSAFDKLKGKLAHKPGVTSPGGLAAYIGRKKLGEPEMERRARAGRRHAHESGPSPRAAALHLMLGEDAPPVQGSGPLKELADAAWNGAVNPLALIHNLSKGIEGMSQDQVRSSPEVKIVLGQLAYLLGEGPGPSQEAVDAYLGRKSSAPDEGGHGDGQDMPVEDRAYNLAQIAHYGQTRSPA